VPAWHVRPLQTRRPYPAEPLQIMLQEANRCDITKNMLHLPVPIAMNAGAALALAATIALGGLTGQAHHSISSVYDNSRRLTIDGTVAEFQLINPHPILLVDVKDSSGTVLQWRGEMDNRSELVAIGVAAGTFAPGDRVVITGSLARAQPQSLYIWRLDRPADGFWYEQVGSSPRIRPSP
jgi:Family of unknown function (DUF6152)